LAHLAPDAFTYLALEQRRPHIHSRGRPPLVGCSSLCWPARGHTHASKRGRTLSRRLAIEPSLAVNFEQGFARVRTDIGTCNFCTDVTFGATVKDGGRRVVLDLGSAEPRTCRVAAAHSIVSLRRFGTVEFTIRQLEHAANHHVVLWLGLLYDKHHGRSIEHSTLREALGAYDVSHPTGGSMRDRFACRPWSMNAVGSSGAVWSDGAVVRLLGQRFGPGDRVRLRLGDDSRSLRVAITHAASGLCSEHLAIRRLVRDLSSAAPPRLHAIVHLSDVAVPTIGSSARAVVEVAA